jgi:signal transduction histidine kinase
VIRRSIDRLALALRLAGRALSDGVAAPPETLPVRQTRAAAFAALWIVTGADALLIRLTSVTRHVQVVVAIGVGLVVLGLVVAVLGKRIPRRMLLAAVAATVLVVAPASHLAVGPTYVFLYYASAIVVVAYFMSAFETAFLAALVSVLIPALGVRVRGDTPWWYAPLIFLLLALPALIVIMVRGRYARALGRLRESRRRTARANTILGAVAYAAERLLSGPDWVDVMPDVLARLGTAAGANRVFVFENERANGTLHMCARHEWTDGNTVARLEELRSVKLFDSWIPALADGRPHLQVVAEMPDHERALMVSDVRSVLLVPIHAGGRWWGEFTFDDAERDRRWTTSEVRALRAAAGALATAIERQQAEETLRREELRQRELEGEIAHLEHLRDIARLKDELIASVSHELRTPLSSVLAMGEQLATRDLDAPTRGRYARLLRRQGDRLTDLVDEFLELQRFESGARELRREPVALGAVAAEVVSEAAARHEEHTFRLALPDGAAEVVGDERLLERLITNLVSNAVKYSPDGGHVEVTIEELGSSVRLGVQDEGIGIPDDAREHIFEKFFRVQSPQTEAIGGTGLGLALSREIVEAHGGRIGCANVDDGGAEFWFELPRGGAA